MRVKVFSIFMFALCILFTANASKKSEYSKGLFWEINDKTVIISGNGPMVDHRSPWHGYYVEKVVIEEGITSIGGWVFWDMSKLQTVIIPNSVTSIKSCAFYKCPRLQSIIIPSSVTRIEERIFGECPNLQSITVLNPNASIDKYAFNNNSNATILKPFFGPVNNEYWIATDNKGKNPGLKDGEGNWIIPVGSYDEIIAFKDSYIKIKKDGKYGLTDIVGNIISPCVFDDISSFDGNYLKVKKDYKYGLITSSGKEIIPCIYQELTQFDGNYLKVKKDYKYGLISIAGKELIPTEVDDLATAGKGFLKFKINGFWGVMNYQGKIIIPTDRGYTYIGNYVTMTKRFPYEMDGYKGECNSLGQQVSKIKVSTQKSAPNANTSVPSNSTSSGKQEIIIKHEREKVPVQVWVKCGYCNGSGQCAYCLGYGYNVAGYKCNTCHGNGRCTKCAGKGGQYNVEYK